uniref:Uncharacterized protein n=1 Tax=Anguilla anguilla TaxID=7936 RepID=A0A0E9TJK1_ANGAN
MGLTFHSEQFFQRVVLLAFNGSQTTPFFNLVREHCYLDRTDPP